MSYEALRVGPSLNSNSPCTCKTAGENLLEGGSGLQTGPFGCAVAGLRRAKVFSMDPNDINDNVLLSKAREITRPSVVAGLAGSFIGTHRRVTWVVGEACRRIPKCIYNRPRIIVVMLR